jgi:hypothetical protein
MENFRTRIMKNAGTSQSLLASERISKNRRARRLALADARRSSRTQVLDWRLTSSLEGNVHRAIDTHESRADYKTAFNALIRQAIDFNSSNKQESSEKAKA